MNVALVARVKTSKGRFVFRNVPFAKNNRVELAKLERVGQITHYYLRYTDATEAKRRRAEAGKPWTEQSSPVIVESAGDALEAALARYEEKTKAFDRLRLGLPGETRATRKLIADGVAAYETELNQKRENWLRGGKGKKDKLSPNSVRRYLRFIRQFQKVVGVQYFDEIDATKLLNFKVHLQNETRGDGAHDRIVADAFQVLNKFLRRNNVRLVRVKGVLPNDRTDRGLLDYDDFPTLSKDQKRSKKAESYLLPELVAMMEACEPTAKDSDEHKAQKQTDREILLVFLKTGMRRGEVAHFTYDWIDWDLNRINIDDQLGFGWRVKDQERRWTWLAPDLRDSLAKRLKRMEGSTPKEEMAKESDARCHDLVFPAANGGPDDHLDRVLLRVVAHAREAGAKFKGLIELHKFRKTWATEMLKHYPINEVRERGGWADLETLQIYLADQDDKTKTNHALVDAAFPGVG
jgi:integrase